MATLRSFELNGEKESFAEWISNLSPEDTPFLSMIKKEKVQQTEYNWQIDYLTPPTRENARHEGSEASEDGMRSTTSRPNYTQIFSKVVKVSKTARKVGLHGRTDEFLYQMEKAAKELKRDIEWALVRNLSGTPETPNVGRVTAGFHALVAPLNTPDPYTGAVVHKVSNASNIWGELRNISYELYMAGAKPSVIMIHPSKLMDVTLLQELNPAMGANISANRMRIFNNTPELDVEITSIEDPLGQVLDIIPNRYMATDTGYIFNPDDWTCMVLREPTRTKLDSDGSYDKWMIECELGLRLNNPYAAGIFSAHSFYHRSDVWKPPAFCGIMFTDAETNRVVALPLNAQISPNDISHVYKMKEGTPLGMWGAANAGRKIGSIYMERNGICLPEAGFTFDGSSGLDMAVPLGINKLPTKYSDVQIIYPSITKEHAGVYTLEQLTDTGPLITDFDASITRGLRLAVQTNDGKVFPPL